MTKETFDAQSETLETASASLIARIDATIRRAAEAGYAFTEEGVMQILDILQPLMRARFEHAKNGEPDWLSALWREQKMRLDDHLRVFRDVLSSASNLTIESRLSPLFAEIREQSTVAAADQDRDGLLRSLHSAKACQAKLSQWNDALGTKRVSAHVLALEHAFGGLADDISSAINGELPGQALDAGEDLKT